MARRSLQASEIVWAETFSNNDEGGSVLTKMMSALFDSEALIEFEKSKESGKREWQIESRALSKNEERAESGNKALNRKTK